MTGVVRDVSFAAMQVGCSLERNVYFDSVFLMRASSELSARPGVISASLVMATEANKEHLRNAGLLTAAGEAANPDDLLIALAVEDGADLDDELRAARGVLDAPEQPGADAAGAHGDGTHIRPRALAQALKAGPANLAMVSTPGTYAAAEALKALRLGMHVFLFSDNVSIEDEIALKREAERRGLLVMGPDCGTSIINGAPLGFANVVRRGDIGLVGASGTGLQQISTLIDNAGRGVSQVIGVGGRDLSPEVGGSSMLRALDALASDPATAVVVLVSKPPDEAVAARVLERAARAGKPVVVCFLGARHLQGSTLVHPADTLQAAAAAAVSLGKSDRSVAGQSGAASPDSTAEAPDGRPRAAGRTSGRLRALYSGGTFAYEADLIAAEALGGTVHAIDGYVPGRPYALPDAHLVLDLGDDSFTVGRPHPMIDPTVRAELLQAAVEDRRSGVVLIDVVLGYGAAADPVGPLLHAIESAAAAPDGPQVHAFVVGTAADPQDRALQEQRLRDAGATVWPSSTAAACAAAAALGAEQQTALPPAASIGAGRTA